MAKYDSIKMQKSLQNSIKIQGGKQKNTKDVKRTKMIKHRK